MRAGLIAQGEPYEWSSAAIHLGLTRDRLHLADLEFWHQEGAAETWRSLLMTPDELTTLRLLRRCTYASRPLPTTTSSTHRKAVSNANGGLGFEKVAAINTG